MKRRANSAYERALQARHPRCEKRTSVSSQPTHAQITSIHFGDTRLPVRALRLASANPADRRRDGHIGYESDALQLPALVLTACAPRAPPTAVRCGGPRP